jgi:hypothetical protein
MSSWTDAIVADRMTVDREFADRVRASPFDGQEWELVMSATDLEIEHPDDPDRARLVANTEDLPAVVPELDEISSGPAAMGGAGGGGGSSGTEPGGIVGAIKSALGLDETAADDRLDAAERLTQEYAETLQRHLEAEGKWERVRQSYGD